MSLIVRKLFRDDPCFERLTELQDRVSRRAFNLFENEGLWGRDLENWLQAESEVFGRIPLDVTESDHEIEVRAEVPGFREDQLDVRLEGRRILITGKREEKKEEKKAKTLYRERRADEIFRAYELPSEIDAEKAKATLTAGVLEIKLPKVETGKKVPVSAKAA